MRTLTLVGLCLLAAAAAAQDPRLQDSFRQDKNGWVFAHLEGSPNQIGFQYGYLIAPEIDDANKALKAYLKQATSEDWDFYRNAAQRLYWPKVPREYKQEILGMAEGLRARGYHYDSTDMLVQNSWIDFAWYYVPYLKNKQTGGMESKAPDMCSAFIATGSETKDGKPVMAHNAWVDYVIGERWNLVLDVKPERGNRFLMDAWPGFIHSGDDFGVNSAGIMITETTIAGFVGFKEDGVPEFVRARKAMQYSNNLDDFEHYMVEGNNGGYANTWLVGNDNTGEIGKLELGLKNVTFERTSDGAYVGSNFPENPNLIAQECDPKQWPSKICLDRKVRWQKLMAENKGKIDADLAEAFLGDHHDEVRGTDGPSATTLCGHFEMDDRPGIALPNEPDHDPFGACEGKVITADLAKHMSFWARMGHPCGEAFSAADFFAKYHDFDWEKPYLRDMPSEPWTLFSAK